MESTTREPKYVTVTTVASETTPGKVYTIKRHVESGALSCNCPAWIYGRNLDGRKPECKHLRGLNRRVAAAVLANETTPRLLETVLNVMNPIQRTNSVRGESAEVSDFTHLSFSAGAAQ